VLILSPVGRLAKKSIVCCAAVNIVTCSKHVHVQKLRKVNILGIIALIERIPAAH
jgi:hypothetical protein